MNNTESLKNVIKAVNTGKSFPALHLVQSNPEVAALVSKMIKPPLQRDHFDLNRRNAQDSLNQSQIQAISDNTKNRTNDNENIVKLFPDIELAVQILVSSILSPKDMVKSDLIYRAREAIFPSEIIMKMNQVVSTHIEGHYAIHDELPEILRDTLFNTGSYVKAVIPESAVDEIINQNRVITTESLSELYRSDNDITPMGFLGNPKTSGRTTSALESFLQTTIKTDYDAHVTVKVDDKDIVLEHLEIIDNYKVLKLPKLIELRNKNASKALIKRTVSYSPEAYSSAILAAKDKKLTPGEMSQLIYKNQHSDSQPFMVVPSKHNSKRKSIGRPLVMHLPSESVIPVHIPGSESKHIGYFVIIDQDGNPVSRHNNQEHMEGLAGALSNQNNNQSLSSMLITKARKNLVANDNMPNLDQITSVYGSIIETELLNRLASGIYGSNVKISNNEEIYRIMLARSLAAKYTRLLYIPAELTTYFAFKYFHNGVGKSYLDDIKNLTSLRAIIMFSKVMAMVKSSISMTHVGITLDDKDPDPMKTIEMAQHEVVKMRQQYFPLGINSPVDLVDWIQRAGLEFSFEGHPGIPQTKFDFEAKNIQHIVPENDLDEMLRKQTYMSFGLSPETVDNGFNSEFATTVVSNNILLSKRIITLQQVFTRDLSDYVQKIITNDSTIIAELKAIIKENEGLIEKSLSDEEKTIYSANKEAFVNDMVDRFIENFQVDLPKPDVTSLHTQTEAFNEYSEALDKVIDSWISQEIVTSEIAGEINGNIDAIKAVVKAYYIRRWMSENGYMVELNDIVTSDDDGKPTVDIFSMNQHHVEGLIRSSLRFIKAMEPIKSAADKDLATLGVKPDDNAGSSSDTGSSDDGGGFSDDFSGGTDMGSTEDSGSNGNEDTPSNPDDTTDESNPNSEDEPNPNVP